MAVPVTTLADAAVADSGAAGTDAAAGGRCRLRPGRRCSGQAAPLISRLLGILATVVGASAFVPLPPCGPHAAGSGGLTQGLVELTAGALFLGAIWVGMILGHWYLVERRLSNRYMVWIAWANVAAIGAGLVSVLLSGAQSRAVRGNRRRRVPACAP
jgi:hypothetical protein